MTIESTDAMLKLVKLRLQFHGMLEAAQRAEELSLTDSSRANHRYRQAYYQDYLDALDLAMEGLAIMKPRRGVFGILLDRKG